MSGVPPLPITLNSSGIASFSVQFVPPSGSKVIGQISIVSTENGVPQSFSLNLEGTSPELAYTFFVSPNGTLAALNPGDRITFPATNLGGSASGTLTILNRGSAAATLQAVNVSGAAFGVTGSTTPIQLNPSQQTFFNVVFTPPALGNNLGALALGINSSTVLFQLAGTGASSSFSVFYTLADGNVHPLANGTQIAFPAVQLNGTTTATIEIQNQGSGPGTVTGISVSGTGFQLTGLPPLPLTVGAGLAAHFGIVFAPPQEGAFSGTFQIDLGNQTISGTLIGSTTVPAFSATYTLTDGVSHPLTDGVSITFPKVDTNATATATIAVLNQGPGTGSVTAVSVSGTAFRLTGVPPLPLNLAVNTATQFGIAFTPAQSGTFTGTFRIDVSGRTISEALPAVPQPPTSRLPMWIRSPAIT